MYLISYLLVLLVPLVIMIYGYVYSSKVIEAETGNYHDNLLRQTRQAYDQVLSLVDAELQVLASNPDVDSLMRAEKWNPEELFEVESLRDELSSVKISNPYCDNIGVYFYQNGDLVTDWRRYPDELMYLYLNDLQVSKEEYLAGINLSLSQGYYLIGHASENLRIIFYQNVYGISFREVYATILISVPWKKIADVAENISLSENGGVFLINSEEQIIGNSNPSVDISDIAENMPSEVTESLILPMNGQSYVVSYLDSEESDLTYVIYTPRKVFYEKVDYLRYAMTAEIILCLVVGLALAIYFSRKTFNPIQEMLYMLEGSKIRRNGDSDNITYERLEASLQKMLLEKDTMEKQLTQSVSYINQGAMVGAMKGWGRNGEQVETYFQELQGNWDSMDYRIVLLKLDNMDQLEKSKLFAGQSQENRMESWSLVFFALRNVMEEILLSEAAGTIVEIENMLACIYNVSAESKEGELENRILKCTAFYKEAFELITYASVSGIHQGMDELALAYEEAYEAISHKVFWGEEVADIIVYDKEMMAEKQTGRQKLMELDKKLLNCLNARDYRKAAELFDEMIERGMKKDIRYLSYNKCNAFSLIGALIRILEEISEEGEEEIFQNLSVSERLLNANSVGELKEEARMIFSEITTYYESRSLKEEPVWLKEVEHYLQNNYQDININISSIAETFGMSLSYMGRTFKQYRGESMLDHIHILRLNRCKELLAEGWSVKDVADTTGYIDSKAMIRAFKRYEGITPGQYKRQS